MKLENHEKTTDSMDQIMSELSIILNTEDPEQQNKQVEIFIRQRMEKLKVNTPEKQEVVSLWKSSITTDFIGEETIVERVSHTDGFKLNDPEIYRYLVDALIKFHKAWGKPETRDIFLNSVIHALGDYFGNSYGSSDTDRKNREFYMDHSTTESEPFNIREFKGLGMAVCVEKAAMAHNLLKFGGIDSRLIFSDCKISELEESHAYIIFSTKNGKFIFDPTNPVIIKNTEGSITSFYPAVYKISDEDYDGLLNRRKIKVTVEHFDQVLDGGVYSPNEKLVRTYS